jgi:hypothetical protein
MIETHARSLNEKIPGLCDHGASAWLQQAYRHQDGHERGIVAAIGPCNQGTIWPEQGFENTLNHGLPGAVDPPD